MIPRTCIGERCTMCGNQANHKVGEENPWTSAPDEYKMRVEFEMRHNFTAYVCDDCFAKIMYIRSVS